jgi:hypothetical protein
MSPKKPGPKKSGKALEGRAAVVCSNKEREAFEAAAKKEGLRVSAWLRRIAVAALPPEIKGTLTEV